MSGTVPRQCAVCGGTTRPVQCNYCRGTYHCSRVCRDSDWPFHQDICSQFREKDFRDQSHGVPRAANIRLVLYFPMEKPHPIPIRLSFGPAQNRGPIDSTCLPSQPQQRAALMAGEAWVARTFITKNHLAQEWLHGRELTVYGASRDQQLPINRSIVAALARGGEACDEDVWRGPFVVVAAQRQQHGSWSMVARRTLGQPGALLTGAIIEDATPWDYRQVLNFAIKPSGPGVGTSVQVPGPPTVPSLDLPPEDVRVWEQDVAGVDGLDDAAGSEGSGTQVETPSLSGSWVLDCAASPDE